MKIIILCFVILSTVFCVESVAEEPLPILSGDCAVNKEIRNICARCIKASGTKKVFKGCCENKDQERDFCNSILTWKPTFIPPKPTQSLQYRRRRW